MKNICILLLFLFCASARHAGAQPTFRKLYHIGGGSLGALGFTTTVDGEAIVAFDRVGGSAITLGVLRVDAAGAPKWIQGFVPSLSVAVPVGAAATPDSGAVLLLANPMQMNAIELMKMSKSGGVQWAKSFPANYSSLTSWPIYALADGSILMAHASQDSLCLKKFSSSGSLLWARAYETSGTSIIEPSALIYHDSSFYMGGYDNDSYSAFLMRTDAAGNILWQKRGAGDVSARMHIVPVQSGGVMIGTTRLTATPESRVAFYRADGSVAWSQRMSLIQLQMYPVNSNAVGIATEYNHTLTTAIIDTTGAMRQVRIFNDSLLTSPYRTSGGITGRDYWVCSIEGNRLWLMRADTAATGPCAGSPGVLLTTPLTILPVAFNLTASTTPAAITTLSPAPQPLFVSDSTLCVSLSVPTAPVPSGIRCYPNPTRDRLIIQGADGGSYRLVTADGRTVASGPLMRGETALSVASIPPGLYFLSVTEKGRPLPMVKVVKE